MKVTDLKPHEKNPRLISDKKKSKLEETLDKYGDLSGVVFNSANKRLVGGHMRVNTFKKAKSSIEYTEQLKEPDKQGTVAHGYIVIDGNKYAYREVHWEDDLAHEAAMIIANYAGGDWDDEKMGAWDRDWLEDEVGWDRDLEDQEAEQLEPTEGDDDVPDVKEDPITVKGDLYELGGHRVLCGDSTMIDDVEKLMDGEKADMVFTDPPYGISYSSSKFDGNKKGLTNKRNKAEMIIGDDDNFDPGFIIEHFKSVKEIFIWGMQYYPKSLGRGGVICWNKKKESEESCPHGDFELCWSKSERNKMCWLRWGGFNNKEKGESRLHTTQKPVDLFLWFLSNWGEGSILVTDLFLGSGSTLIACEKTNRKCYGMELDCRYTDVVVKRYIDFCKKNNREYHVLRNGKICKDFEDE